MCMHMLNLDTVISKKEEPVEGNIYVISNFIVEDSKLSNVVVSNKKSIFFLLIQLWNLI